MEEKKKSVQSPRGSDDSLILRRKKKTTVKCSIMFSRYDRVSIRAFKKKGRKSGKENDYEKCRTWLFRYGRNEDFRHAFPPQV